MGTTRATGANNLDELEARLTQLAAQAPGQSDGDVYEQVRALLAYAHAYDQKQPTQRPAKPLSPNAARLSLLVDVVATMNAAQTLNLLTSLEHIQDETLRFDLLSRVARYLPPDKRRDVVDTVWRGVRGVGSASARARLLFQLYPLVEEIQNTPPTSFMAVFDIAQNIDNVETRTRSLIALSRYVPPDLTLSVQRSVLDAVDSMSGDTSKTNTLVSLSETLAPELIDRALACAMDIHTPDERVRALTSLARVLPADRTRNVQEEVLRSIEGIAAEEHRVEALTAFAPYLEYVREEAADFPAILERALAVAVGVTRRQFRARALVALAPMLPSELQGEALAAVHALPYERDRATMLATLAATLPPNMLVASLAVAHTMNDQDARVHALTALAHRLPEQARPQTVRDAFAAAMNLPRQFERVTALMELVDLMPSELVHQVYLSALETTRMIKNVNSRARALNMMSADLPDDLLTRAVDIARTLQEAQQRLSALGPLVERLPAEQQQPLLANMLETLRDIRHEYRRSRAIMSVAALMPKTMQPALIEAAHSIRDPYDRLSALIAIAQNTNAAERVPLVGEAWTLLRQVENGYDRASGLAAIAPLLPASAEGDLTRAVGMVIGSIMDEYDQASAIILLAPLLATDKTRTINLPSKTAVLRDAIRVALRTTDQAERAELLAEGVRHWVDSVPTSERAIHNALWSDLIPRMGVLPLADVVLCVGALLPLVRHLAGERGVQEVLSAMGLAP